MEHQKQCIRKPKIAFGVPTREEVEDYFNSYETKANHRRTLATLQLESEYYTPHNNSSEKITKDKLDAVVTEVSHLSSLPYYTPNESVQLAESTNVNDSFKTANEEVVTRTADNISKTLADTTHEKEFSNEVIETTFELQAQAVVNHLFELEPENSFEEILKDISRKSIVDPRQDLKSVSNPFETAYESSFEEIAQTVGDIVKKLHLEVEEDSCIIISDDEDGTDYVEEEYVNYEEKSNASKCSDVSCNLYSEQESDRKMHMAESSTSQAETLIITEYDENFFVKEESHITSECEKRLHDDSSFNFNDTLDEINQLLAGETKQLDNSKDSGSYPALTTPYMSKIPLIVTPTRPLSKENKPQQEFKLPKKPTPKKVQPKYKDIKSPVALYIKNSPLAPLQRKLPAKPIKVPSPAVSCEKRPPLQEVLSLPQVVYVPAQKKVTTHEKPLKLPQVISKHMSPRGNIIKHEKRTNAHSRDVSKLLSDNNLTINATNNDDVSLLHVKEEFIV